MNEMHPGDDRLIAHAMNEIDPTDRHEVDAHVAACPTCRGVLSRLSAALDAFRRTPATEAPVGILIDLLEAQAAARERPARPWWQRRPVLTTAALATLVLLFGSGFVAGRSSVPLRESPSTRLDVRQTLPRPLPDPPAIEFRAELPFGARFAFADATTFVMPDVLEGSESTRDSL